MVSAIEVLQSRRMPSYGMIHHVALVRTDVSEERIASIIKEKIIGELKQC
jgi:hypothetical protein